MTPAPSSLAPPSSSSFDAEENASILSDVFKENQVYLGGSAIGKGFRRSARYYLQSIGGGQSPNVSTNAIGGNDDKGDDELGIGDLEIDHADLPPEDPFFVMDLGVVVYQYYNWCRHFPRVQPYYAVKCNP